MNTYFIYFTQLFEQYAKAYITIYTVRDEDLLHTDNHVTVSDEQLLHTGINTVIDQHLPHAGTISNEHMLHHKCIYTASEAYFLHSSRYLCSQ